MKAVRRHKQGGAYISVTPFIQNIMDRLQLKEKGLQDIICKDYLIDKLKDGTNKQKRSIKNLSQQNSWRINIFGM